MEHDILGEVVKAARIHKGLSQEQLAEILDCTPRHIMGIENENKKPGYMLLYNLIRTLHIPADTVFYPERMYTTSEKDKLISKLTALLYDCDEHDLKILLAAIRAAKNAD
ncbi:MAG: helix-turn-helix domain-containing protein [Firmicutes bacterium]|nr:helix-turn-helix domain-containing protein [Bacillota bacterium]